MPEDQPNPAEVHLINLVANSQNRDTLIQQARQNILNNLRTALTTADSQEAERIYTTVITALTNQAQKPENFGDQPLFDNDEIEGDIEPLLHTIATTHKIQGSQNSE